MEAFGRIVGKYSKIPDSFGLHCQTVACIEARRMIPYCPYLTYQHLQQWMVSRSLCYVEGKSSVKLISPDLCDPPTKLLNKKQAGVRRAAPLQLPSLHAAKSEMILVLQPIQIRVELLRCFKTTPPRETRALGSTPQPGTGDHHWPPSHQTRLQGRLPDYFCFLFVYFHIYNNKLTSGSLQTLIQA